MKSRRVAAGLGVVCHPGIAFDVLFQNEYVAASCSNHAWSGCGSGEAKPISCQVQFRHDSTKHAQRRTTAAERPRATRRTSSDNLGAGAIGFLYFPPAEISARA
jgi:hypothetical protein